MPKPLTTAQHLDRLEKGWAWLARNPNHRAYEENLGRWIKWLRRYEAHVRGGGA